MKHWACSGFVPLAIGLIMETGCGSAQGSASVHYRITVEVDDNGTIRSGSNVWESEVVGTGLARGPMHSSGQSYLRGDAVTVQIPGRGTLFALLSERGPDGDFIHEGQLAAIPEALFGDFGRTRRREQPQYENRLDDLRAISARTGAQGELECVRERTSWAFNSICPYMVTFRDLRNPASVGAVDPIDLSATFGSGVSLRRITVTVVDEPVSRNIKTVLPWLDEYRDRWFSGLRHGTADPSSLEPETSHPLARRLSYTNFSKS